MKIIVLAGALSPEREVSLSSGNLIANALKENGHDVVLLDYLDFFSESNVYSSKLSSKIIERLQNCDIVFLALHGDMGENGQIQAVFDTFGIRYTGSGQTGSLLAMNKQLSKELFILHNIPTPEWQLAKADNSNKIPLPCVIKPANGGSSIGVGLVFHKEELQAAIKKAEEFDQEIIIEKFIAGRELSVGILDNTPLPIIEIIPEKGFYDYENKYQPGKAVEICPAPLKPDQTKKIQETALRVHRLLKLSSYSRVDFILKDDGTYYCLEANSLPGMTPTSLLPQEAAVAGIDFNQLCEKIISLSLLTH